MPFRERLKHLTERHSRKNQPEAVELASLTVTSPQGVTSLITNDETSIPQPKGLWDRAERELRRDPAKRKIHDAYLRILEENYGSKLGTNVEREAQLRLLLDSKCREIQEKKLRIRLGSERSVELRNLLVDVSKKILAVRDLVVGAASASPPAAIALAGGMALLLVGFSFIEISEAHICFHHLHYLLQNSTTGYV